MSRKSLFITALFVSSVGMTGCSSMWSGVGDFAYNMSEKTSNLGLRGMFGSKDSVKLAEVETPIGADTSLASFDTSATMAETGFEQTDTASDLTQNFCPDGTYLTDDDICMALDSDNYELNVDTYDMNYATQAPAFEDNSTAPCPEGTYYAGENECRSVETETFDLDSFNVAENFEADCPEGFVATAGNSCMYAGAEN